VLKSTIGLAVVLLCCASAYSQQTQRGQTSSIREIIPGHYIFSSGDLNSGGEQPTAPRYVTACRNLRGMERLDLRAPLPRTMSAPVCQSSVMLVPVREMSGRLLHAVELWSGTISIADANPIDWPQCKNSMALSADQGRIG
jgi:hypothetical protein